MKTQAVFLSALVATILAAQGGESSPVNSAQTTARVLQATASKAKGTKSLRSCQDHSGERSATSTNGRPTTDFLFDSSISSGSGSTAGWPTITFPSDSSSSGSTEGEPTITFPFDSSSSSGSTAGGPTVDFPFDSSSSGSTVGGPTVELQQ